MSYRQSTVTSDTAQQGHVLPSAETAVETPRFMCPYLKYNPTKYKHSQYCTGRGWPDVHRLKYSQPLTYVYDYDQIVNSTAQTQDQLTECEEYVLLEVPLRLQDPFTPELGITVAFEEPDVEMITVASEEPEVEMRDAPSQISSEDKQAQIEREHQDAKRRQAEAAAEYAAAKWGVVEQQLKQVAAQHTKRLLADAFRGFRQIHHRVARGGAAAPCSELVGYDFLAVSDQSSSGGGGGTAGWDWDVNLDDVHADAASFDEGVTKEQAYAQVLLQAEGLFEGQRNWVWYVFRVYSRFCPPVPLNLANAASLLWHAYKSLPPPSSQVNWAGFYTLDPRHPQQQQLVLGPFQGKVACQTIAFGRGVCGAAAATRRTQLVPDVERFPGHIACDGASRSEIVVPIVLAAGDNDKYDGEGTAGGRTVAIIDVDCAELDGFDEVDRRYLERLAELLARSCDW
ncbi:GAF domain-like protein [Xylariaceae sp. FL0804]|nr:GAF domain-like protein [Xylariaceae sp. FL0804]